MQLVIMCKFTKVEFIVFQKIADEQKNTDRLLLLLLKKKCQNGESRCIQNMRYFFFRFGSFFKLLFICSFFFNS